MYLNYLKIIAKSPIERIIRDIPFKNGLNIIIDDSDNPRKQGNNVGKTTFLKLIDLAFGAKSKKYIWADADTKSVNTTVKNFINEQKVFIELSFTKNKIDYLLRVDLFNYGKRYIDNKNYSLNDYQEKLNEIVFEIHKPPSFRSLIGKFIRINLKKDQAAVLKYLDNYTSNIEYQSIYRFLFKLSSQEINNKILEFETAINTLENDLKKILKLNNLANFDDLSQRRAIVKNHVEKYQKELDALTNIKFYQQNLSKSIEIKKQLNFINDKLDFLNFQQTKMNDVLIKESEDKNKVDLATLHNFYNEVKTQLGSLSKEFEDLIEFNEKIRSNKINYYKNRIHSITKEIEELSTTQQKLLSENQNIVQLINDDNFEEFEITHENLLKQSEKLGNLNNVEAIYTSLQTELDDYKVNLSKVNQNINTNNLIVFNKYFTALSEKTFKQNLYLRASEGFPLELSNIDEGVGTGVRKSLALLLDISYVSFINELKLSYPKFFIHDVLESVSSQNFKHIVDAINNNNSQFIFAVLKEKIKDYDFITDKDIILTLSEDNKLFKI